jgi:hypothetical protein
MRRRCLVLVDPANHLLVGAWVVPASAHFFDHRARDSRTLVGVLSRTAIGNLA